jgi:hypothetical protein
MSLDIPTGVLFFAPYMVLFFTLPVLTGLWVFRDSRARGSDQPFFWGIGSALLSPFFPLYYLYRRYRRAGLGCRAESPTKYDRLLAMWVNASFIALIVGLRSGGIEPGLVVTHTYVLLGVLLPIMYLLVYRGEYRTVLDRVRV